MDTKLQERVNRYELAVAFAKEFIGELGEQQALGIIRRAFERLQAKAGKELAEQLKSNSLDALAEHYRKQAAESDNLELLEVTDRRIALKVSRCLSWEAFKLLGAPEICRIYCESDHAYIKAFNPNLKKTKTRKRENETKIGRGFGPPPIF